MYGKSSAFSMSAVVASRTRESIPTVTLVDYETISNNMARVVVDVVHNRFTRDNHSLVGQAISQSFDNKLYPVAQSYDTISTAPMTERITGLIRVNSESIPADVAIQNGFRSVSSNIFFDTEDKMWSLKKSASGDVLVSNTGIEDEAALADILGLHCMSAGARSMSSADKRALASLSAAQEKIDGGDFIDFVSEDGDVASGFVMASVSGEETLVVLGVTDSQPVEVSRSAVLQAHDVSTFPDPKFSEREELEHTISVSRGAVDIKFLLDYYKKVYRRSPAFFKQFEKRVRSHAFM